MFRSLLAISVFFLGTTAHAQGDPIAGAKRVITTQYESRSLKAMANNYTNETAAGIGLFLSAGSNMILKQGLHTSSKPETAQEKTKRLEALAQFRQINDALSDILRKYDAAGYNSNPVALLMAMGGKNREAVMPALLKENGRAMLVEVAETFVQIVPGARDDIMKGMARRNKVLSPAAMSYKVLSPTRVAVNDKNGKPTLMEARYEDGRWRLHYALDTQMARR